MSLVQSSAFLLLNRIKTKQKFELDFEGLGFLPWLEIFEALSEKDVILLLRVVVLVAHRPVKTKQYWTS